jgi:hypothetical protein
MSRVGYALAYAVALLAALPVLAYVAAIRVGPGMVLFRFLVSPLLLLLTGAGLLTRAGRAHKGSGLLLLLLDGYWLATLYLEVGDGGI